MPFDTSTSHRDGPFFLYLAHSLPHIPLARSAEFEGRSAAGIYGDVVEELDESTGRILDALKAAGIDRNTLVVFTSDNGPWLPFGSHGGSAGPLRSGKGTTWEGGVRTPAIFWWPGTIKPATVTDTASAMDLFVTAAKLSGGEVPADRVIDGVDLRAPLTGSGPGPLASSITTGTTSFARFVKDPTKPTSSPAAPTTMVKRGLCTTPPLLFNLADDPGERHDVADRHPEIVADLVREADAHRRSMVAGPPLFDALLPTR